MERAVYVLLLLLLVVVRMFFGSTCTEHSSGRKIRKGGSLRRYYRSVFPPTWIPRHAKAYYAIVGVLEVSAAPPSLCDSPCRSLTIFTADGC
jgi:hypothetical protein